MTVTEPDTVDPDTGAVRLTRGAVRSRASAAGTAPKNAARTTSRIFMGLRRRTRGRIHDDVVVAGPCSGLCPRGHALAPGDTRVRSLVCGPTRGEVRRASARGRGSTVQR